MEVLCDFGVPERVGRHGNGEIMQLTDLIPADKYSK